MPVVCFTVNRYINRLGLSDGLLSSNPLTRRLLGVKQQVVATLQLVCFNLVKCKPPFSKQTAGTGDPAVKQEVCKGEKLFCYLVFSSGFI